MNRTIAYRLAALTLVSPVLLASQCPFLAELHQADLEQRVANVSGPTVPIGGDIVWTGTTTNLGPGLATEVNVTARISPPQGVEFEFDETADGCTVVTATVLRCRFQGLGIGAEAELTITVANAALGTWLVEFEATAAQTDPDPANNQARTSTSVQAANALAPAAEGLSGIRVEVN